MTRQCIKIVLYPPPDTPALHLTSPHQLAPCPSSPHQVPAQGLCLQLHCQVQSEGEGHRGQRLHASAVRIQRHHGQAPHMSPGAARPTDHPEVSDTQIDGCLSSSPPLQTEVYGPLLWGPEYVTSQCHRRIKQVLMMLAATLAGRCNMDTSIIYLYYILEILNL